MHPFIPELYFFGFTDVGALGVVKFITETGTRFLAGVELIWCRFLLNRCPGFAVCIDNDYMRNFKSDVCILHI